MKCALCHTAACATCGVEVDCVLVRMERRTSASPDALFKGGPRRKVELALCAACQERIWDGIKAGSPGENDAERDKADAAFLHDTATQLRAGVSFPPNSGWKLLDDIAKRMRGNHETT